MKMIKRALQSLALMIVFVTAVVVFTPLDKIVLNQITARHPYKEISTLNDYDGFIVLSPFGYLKDEAFLPNERLKLALKIHEAYPDKKIIFSGACPSYPKCEFNNKENIVRYLLDNNISNKNIYFEAEAKTTNENAKFTAKLFPEALSGKWGLVTSDYHMPRAFLTFTKYKFNVEAIPSMTKFRKYRMLRHELHELGGLLYYRLRGVY